ncbi:MAG: MraY family glycosyltransferase [Candidatus Dojkabacteria bacterium]|nr:MraY family glycosyltransferase [Candidatus Dojkabacteria bacterium]
MFGLTIPQNYLPYLDYAPLFLLSLAVSFLLTPIVGIIARKLRILGLPPSMRKGAKPSDFRHLEKQPTPLLGGIAVVLPLIILTVSNISPSQEISALLLAVTVLAVMGIIDDFHELSGRAQLFIQCGVALFLCATTIDISLLNNPLNGVIPLDQHVLTGSFLGFDLRFLIPGDFVLFAWILICTLAVKFSSGTDGLMEGNSLIASVIFFLLSVRFNEHGTAVVSSIFAGLLLGFLVFNFYPAKIWSGSPGKSTFGFILAVLSVISGTKFATAIVILLLPLVDFVFVVTRRFLVHRPKNPLELLSISDKSHFHHRLLELGLSERRIAFIEYLATGILGTIALAMAGTMKASLVLAVGVVLFGTIFVIPALVRRAGLKRPSSPTPESPESKYSY